MGSMSQETWIKESMHGEWITITHLIFDTLVVNKGKQQEKGSGELAKEGDIQWYMTATGGRAASFAPYLWAFGWLLWDTGEQTRWVYLVLIQQVYIPIESFGLYGSVVIVAFVETLFAQIVQIPLRINISYRYIQDGHRVGLNPTWPQPHYHHSHAQIYMLTIKTAHDSRCLMKNAIYVAMDSLQWIADSLYHFLV